MVSENTSCVYNLLLNSLLLRLHQLSTFGLSTSELLQLFYLFLPVASLSFSQLLVFVPVNLTGTRT